MDGGTLEESLKVRYGPADGCAGQPGTAPTAPPRDVRGTGRAGHGPRIAPPFGDAEGAAVTGQPDPVQTIRDV